MFGVALIPLTLSAPCGTFKRYHTTNLVALIQAESVTTHITTAPIWSHIPLVNL